MSLLITASELAWKWIKERFSNAKFFYLQI